MTRTPVTGTVSLSLTEQTRCKTGRYNAEVPWTAKVVWHALASPSMSRMPNLGFDREARAGAHHLPRPPRRAAGQQQQSRCMPYVLAAGFEPARSSLKQPATAA